MASRKKNTERITINDIARISGYSKTAVSFAFNNPARISAKTRKHILEVAEKMGYIPDPMARNLSLRRHHTIGFLLPQVITVAFQNPYLSQIFQGIGETCQKRGYTVMVIPPVRQSIEEGVKGAAVDALITLGLKPEMEVVEIIQRRRIPFVTIDGIPSEEIPSINIDDRRAAEKLMAYILQLGHRQIAILSLLKDQGEREEEATGVRAQRLKGYEDALKSFGLDPENSPITEIECECSLHGGWDAARRVLEIKPRSTAVVAMSDIMALGCHAFFREHGIKIPHEISLAGFDNIPESWLVSPPLTTISQPGYEKGKKAMELLLGIIEKKVEKRHIELETELVIRGSCAPPGD
ncbi:MAG: LacI family transcriptional regulator [Spirochaetes bacterium]|nr:MAG: LacI family transcriptional regulator [Spirochaetota bacterium]